MMKQSLLLFVTLVTAISAVLVQANQSYGSTTSSTDLTSQPTSATSYTASQITLPLSPPATYTFGKPRPTSYAVSSPCKEAKTCTVIPKGWGRDDSGSIHKAVERCGDGGVIHLPAPYVYTVAKRLYTKLNNAKLNIFGTLTFTSDLGYWIDNSHRITFQNQSTAWIVEGNDIVIDGGGFNQGGIDGNGQAWYTHANGYTNQFGRPIPITIYNSTNVTLKDFSVRQPQFWTMYVQDSERITLHNIHVNGTNQDPYGNKTNYEINLDGFNSFRVDGLSISNWLFKGGDDCVSFKGNSTNIYARNITCTGGGVAFGSLGQYQDLPEYITNATIQDLSVTSYVSPIYGGANVSAAAYLKSWVGKPEGTPPQGGGGGTGYVSNVTFSNVAVNNAGQAVYINKCYYKVPDQANYCDSSTFGFNNMAFHNVSGLVRSQYGIALNCSALAPCTNFSFTDLSLHTTNQTALNYCGNVKNLSGLTCA